VNDLHLGGAVMWIAGDCLMFGLMMLVFMMWSTDERASTSGRSWFELARRENLATLVASQPSGAGPQAAGDLPAGRLSAGRGGGVDDDEHLAAYNAYLARLNQAPPDSAR
jgi:putative copper resistance protein D